MSAATQSASHAASGSTSCCSLGSAKKSASIDTATLRPQIHASRSDITSVTAASYRDLPPRQWRLGRDRNRLCAAVGYSAIGYPTIRSVGDDKDVTCVGCYK